MLLSGRCWLFSFAVLAALLSLTACGGGGSSEAPTATADQSIDLSGLVITMSRGPCLGPCPIYTLTVRADGTVEYNGTGNVDALGFRSGSVNLDNLRRVVQRLDSIDFFNIPEDSDCLVTDVPRTTMSVSFGGRSNAVTHCSIMLDHTPVIEQLVEIEKTLDDITASSRWTGPPRTPSFNASDAPDGAPPPAELDRVIIMQGAHYPEPGVTECTTLPCVDYSVTVYRSGVVEYRGATNVDISGLFTTKIRSDTVNELLDAFQEIGYFELAPDLHCQVAPATATISMVMLADRITRIERCHVDDPSGRLEPLRQLEVEIAALVDLEQWVGADNLP